MRGVAMLLLAIVTALCSVAIASRLHLDPNVASLLPERGESSALRRYSSAFGGSDLALVLVTARATDGGGRDRLVDEVRAAAETIATRVKRLPTVRFAAAGIDTREAIDPMLVWRHADADARARLAEALTPEGMRARLRGSRAMLLAPGAGSAAETIARDPLRLASLVRETRGVGSGFLAQADGSFASDDGLARLVLIVPDGQALRGTDAKRFVSQTQAVIDDLASAHPDLRLGLTGGHAIAVATERMLVRDLAASSALSLALAALAFIAVFRRARALLAVMPPLLLGTVWTAGIAAALPGGLSAIAVAFMSVVIGVGVDTGVHVHAAVLDARRAGVDPQDAARVARTATLRPVSIAAITAALAFGALALSDIGALRQLGLLCAAGEILTTIAILVVTPEVAAWLERGEAPRNPQPKWIALVSWLTAKRARALVLLALLIAPLALVALGVRPVVAEAIVALRPARLEPLAVQEEVYRAFGGRRGQWVLLFDGADRQAAMARADAVAERLASMPEDVESVDALTALVPARETQRARLAARDRLDLAAKANELERALADVGFAPARFAAALEAMRRPAATLVEIGDVENGDAASMLSRFLAHDGSDLVAMYLLPRAGREGEVERAIRETDPLAAITGYARLESSLRATLARDLPRIGVVAAALVVAALALALRRALDVALALGVVLAEMGVVLLLVKLTRVPIHVYDALVLPVLLGITVDEAMFMLLRARSSEKDAVRETLASEGPVVATTALTTAAGFAGLMICEFDGLRHLGAMGAIGSVAGLLVAFVVIPAGMRLAQR
jgi:predicted RND superfamily exporter protein